MVHITGIRLVIANSNIIKTIEALPHFMFLTQYAAPNIMFIHNKMPVIFDSSDAALLRDWLNPEATPPWDADRVLKNSVTEIVYEKSPVQSKRRRQPKV